MPFQEALGVQVSVAPVRSFHRLKEVCPAFLKYHRYCRPVPPVLQTHSLRLYRNRHRAAKLDRLADRLLGDGKRLIDGDGNGVGLHGIIQSVGHYAIELNAVPCGVGRAGFGRAGTVFPQAEGSLSRLFEVPPVLQTPIV